MSHIDSLLTPEAKGAVIRARIVKLAQEGYQVALNKKFSEKLGNAEDTEKFAKANPAVVSGFQKAIYAAGKAGMAPSTLNAVVRASMKITKQTFVTAKAANPTYYPSAVLLSEVQSVADKMTTLGFLKKKVSVKRIMP